MSFIIDSSVSLSWCFPDEANEITEALYILAREAELIVPPLWHLEMANVLGLSLRRGRMDIASMDEALAALSKLNLRTVELQQKMDIAAYTFHMRMHGLTAYDATYVMLAQELNLPIATFDTQIIAAARHAGIPLIQVVT